MNAAVVIAVVAVVAVVAIVVAFAVTRANRSRDGVDSFRRQIDALSPEARRPVVDQVQQRIDPRPAGADDDGEGSGGDAPDADQPADGDQRRDGADGA